MAAFGVGGQNALAQLAASLGRQALEQNFGLEERVNRELVAKFGCVLSHTGSHTTASAW